MPPSVVIVGASLAGASAAATLRQEGFDGDVMLIGAEPQLPYERPPLSKQYLRGELPFERMLVRPAAFYEQNRIDTLLGVPASSRATGQLNSRTADAFTTTSFSSQPGSATVGRQSPG